MSGGVKVHACDEADPTRASGTGTGEGQPPLFVKEPSVIT